MSHSLMGRSSSHSVGEKVATAFIVVAPFVAVISSFFLWESFAVPAAVWQIPIWYVLTVQAITVSFHRELTHRALTLRPAARYTEQFLALFSVEGTAKDWCARHRKHHQYTDEERDPHSPHGHGSGAMGVLKGFIHAHFGWFFRHNDPEHKKYVPDLLQDRGLVVLDRLFPVIAVLSFVLPGLITLIFEPSLKGFFAGVFWGGFVRIFLVHHVTWSINSVCHLWGTRPFKSGDESTNNIIFGILGGGEGWHRNHHAFPNSARIGLRWWELDWGWIVIKILDFFGFVERLKVPSPEQVKAKMV
jgi:stearoyl-CoA desaturase (Delta-9 desaturase)